MIVTKSFKYQNVMYISTSSDCGKYIVDEDGMQYETAIDLATLPKVYTETDIDIPIGDEPIES